MNEKVSLWKDDYSFWTDALKRYYYIHLRVHGIVESDVNVDQEEYFMISFTHGIKQYTAAVNHCRLFECDNLEVCVNPDNGYNKDYPGGHFYNGNEEDYQFVNEILAEFIFTSVKDYIHWLIYQSFPQSVKNIEMDTVTGKVDVEFTGNNPSKMSFSIYDSIVDKEITCDADQADLIHKYINQEVSNYL